MESSEASSFVTSSSDVVSALSVLFTWGACVFHVFVTCHDENWGLLGLSLAMACIGSHWKPNMFEFDVKSLAGINDMAMVCRQAASALGGGGR